MCISDILIGLNWMEEGLWGFICCGDLFDVCGFVIWFGRYGIGLKF